MNSGIFLSFVALALIVLAAYSTGWLFSTFVLRLKWRHFFFEIIAEFVLGLDILALLTLWLGTSGILSAPFIWSILIILTLPANIFKIVSLYKKKMLFFKKNKTFSIILILLAIYTLGSALCYPYAWDELTYHLALPYRWIAEGGLQVFKDNPYSGFPAMPQILFRLGTEIGGILFPRMLVWYSYLVFFVAVYLIFKLHTTRVGKVVFTFVFITSPLLVTMMRETYVEPFIMLNFMAAILAVKGTGHQVLQERRLIILCGIFAGAAAAVKLTGGGVAVLIFLLLLFRQEKLDFKKILELIILFGVGGVVAALPFYLRPLLFTGNPVYPFMADWFGSSEAALQVSKFHHDMGNTHFGIKSITGFITGPVLVAFYGRLFDGIVLGWIFPVMFIFGTLWFLKMFRSESGGTRSLWLPTGFIFYYVFWFFSSQQTRFMIPLLVLAGLMGIRGISVLNQKYYKYVWLGLLIIWGCSLYLPEVRHFYTAWRCVWAQPQNPVGFVGRASRDKGYMEAMTALSEKTPLDSKVMLLFERRGLYVPRKYVIGTPFFQEQFFTPMPDNFSEIYKVLLKNNIDYILQGASIRNPDHLGEYNQKNLEFARMLARLIGESKLSLVWFGEGYGLFKVNKNKNQK
jgi:hypothetical protein